MLRVLPLTLLVAALAAIPARSQPAAGVGRVVLASVVDRQNRPIVDLDADDFVIEEGGQAREVFRVRIADYPVVVLADNSSAAGADFEAIRRAIARFVARIGERPVALGTLDSPPTLLTTFDDARDVVLKRLEALGIGQTVTVRPVEAIANAVGMIVESGSPFAAIVLMSAAPFPPSEAERSVLVAPVLQSGASVHVVARRTAGPVLGSPTAGDDGVVRDLADQTRGQYSTIYAAGSYAIALDRIADRMATEFMVEYLVPPGAPSDPSVRVGVNRPGARVQGLGVSK